MPCPLTLGSLALVTESLFRNVIGDGASNTQPCNWEAYLPERQIIRAAVSILPWHGHKTRPDNPIRDITSIILHILYITRIECLGRSCIRTSAVGHKTAFQT